MNYSKVILTKDQAQAIKIAIREYGKDNVLNDHLSAYPDYQNWEDGLEPLNGLEPHILARALYQPNSYEIKPSPRVGDWVVTPDGTVGKLLAIPFSKPHSKKFKFYVDSLGYRKQERLIQLSELEQAAPEEIKEEKRRRWWAKHGRKPWELKVFDILHDGNFPRTVTGTNHKQKHIELDWSVDLSLERIQKTYRVACFVENRKDMKVDGS